MKRIMVFAPHPDDDVLGCGGSIAKYASEGYEITNVYMTSGEAGSLTCPSQELAALREDEARRASSLLGVKETIFLRNPDGFLEYTRTNLEKLIILLRTKKPDIVYIPHRLDGNEDHRITCKLVLDACLRSAGPWFQECGNKPWDVKTILGYEIWAPLQEVSYSEDITAYMEQKLNALRLHASQLKDIQYDAAVQGLNCYRGLMNEGKYSECFQVFKIKN